MLLLGERYSRLDLAAMALVLGGLTLVQPRPKAARLPRRADARRDWRGLTREFATCPSRT